jgi:hypothetical protein
LLGQRDLVELESVNLGSSAAQQRRSRQESERLHHSIRKKKVVDVGCKKENDLDVRRREEIRAVDGGSGGWRRR